MTSNEVLDLRKIQGRRLFHLAVSNRTGLAGKVALVAHLKIKTNRILSRDGSAAHRVYGLEVGEVGFSD